MTEREIMDELKELIIEKLNLEDMKRDDIGDDDILFGDGLGLDSVDALELSLAVSQKYGVMVDSKTQNVREIFSCVKTLADFLKTKILECENNDE